VRLLVGTALLALLTATESRAGTPRPQGSGFVLRLGAGFGLGKASIGDAKESRGGFAGGLTLGVAGRRFEFDLETALQPFHTKNPVAEEGYRAVYFLPSVRFHGDHVYARLGLGYARFSWAGAEASIPSDGGLAVAAAVGYELAKPRSFPLSIEAYARTATPDFEISCGIVGVQIVGSWYLRKSR
jgi:hypothetical protein